MLERSLPLDPAALTRVAPAVERPGIHLGVARLTASCACGAPRRTIPTLLLRRSKSSSRASSSSSTIGATSGKFVNVAVLEGDHIKIVDERRRPCPTVRRC